MSIALGTSKFDLLNLLKVIASNDFEGLAHLFRKAREYIGADPAEERSRSQTMNFGRLEIGQGMSVGTRFMVSDAD